MAEEEVEYRINFDEVDLAQKLERIRSQIDGALEQSALGSSQATQLSGLGTPGGMSFGSVGAAAMGQYNPQFDAGNFTAPLSFSSNQDAQFWNSAQDVINSNVQSFQFGIQKFRQDIQNFGFNFSAPERVPRIQPGVFQNPLNRDFADEAGRFAASWSGTAIGAAVGSIIPGIGTGTGALVGGGLDLIGDALAGEAYQREDLGSALREIARQSFGRIGSDAAEGIARQIQIETGSFDSMTGGGLNMQQAQSTILDFANQGGFTRAQDADDMARITQGLVENVKDFAQNMGTTMDEAVSIMADLERRAVVSTDQAANLSSRMEVLSNQYSMNQTDLLRLGVQGSEMTRGTGITNQQGFEMAISQRGVIDRLMQSDDPVTRQLMLDYASPGQAALAQMQSNLSFMQSPMGVMMGGARAGGYTGIPGATDDFSGMLNAFGGFISSDPSNAIGLPITAAYAMNDMSQDEQTAMQVGNAVAQLELMGQTVNDANVAAMLKQYNPRMTTTDAMTMVKSVQQGRPDPLNQMGVEALSMLERSGAPRGVGEFVGGAISYGANQVWERFKTQSGLDLVGAGYKATGDFISDEIEDIQDNIFGVQRFRGRGLNEEVAAILSNRDRLFGGIDRTVSAEMKRAEAEKFIDRFMGDSLVSGNVGTYLGDEMTGVFAEYSFGLSDDQKANLLNALQRQGSGFFGLFGAGRTAEQVSADLDVLSAAQIGLGQDFGVGIENQAFEILRNTDINQLVGNLPENAGLSNILNAVAQKVGGRGATFGSLEQQQQDVVMSAIQQNANLRKLAEQGMGPFEGVDMRFRDIQTATDAAIAERGLKQIRVQMGDEFDKLRKSPIYEEAARVAGVDDETADRYMGRLESLISRGAITSMEELEQFASQQQTVQGKTFYQQMTRVFRQDPELQKETIGKSLQVKALGSVSEVSSEALENFYGELEGALGDTNLTQQQIDIIKRGARGKLTAAEISGNDATLALRELDASSRRELLDTYSAQLSSENIEDRKAAASAINRIGGKIGTSALIKQFTSEGKMDQAEQLRKVMNPGFSTESVLRDFKNTIYGGAVRVIQSPKQIEPQQDSDVQ